MSRNMNRNRDGPVHRRSQSLHQPYHAITETYSKEVTTRPLGPVEDFPKDIVNILRETNNQSPPLIRSRENTWTTENFPIVRVPSAQFTDILTELYDYHEVEKYTRRSVTPEAGTLRRQSEFKEMPMEVGKEKANPSKTAPPSYKITPPTPERNTPRNQGIPLKNAEKDKKPLPMYEKYVQEIQQKRSRSDENQNQNQGLPPIPRPRSRSPGTLNNNNLRHIDSSSSESNATSEDVDPRYVYSHDVFVDPTTGRPFTPGRADLDEKKCGKLKINVYFKPPHPPVMPVYTLDEIEIEKQEEILVPKPRPLSSGISAGADGLEPEHSEEMTTRRIPTRTTLLRKENEIVTLPLGRSQSVRHSSRTSGTIRSTTSCKTSERTIPIHVDEQFPRIPRHPELQKLREQREREREQQEARSVDKGDWPKQRYQHQYPATNPNLKERYPDRSPSFISQAPSHKSEIVHSVSSSRAADVIDRRPYLPQKRSSPEELNYGNERHPGNVEVLPYTRGISKTPSVPDAKSERSFKSSTTLPVYPQGERHSTRTTPSLESRDDRHSNRQGKEQPIYIPRNGEKEDRTLPTRQNNNIQELPYTRGISKTPSVQEHPKIERNPSKGSTIHIPVKNEENRTHKPSSKSRAPSTSRPNTQQPYEEVVHIKERYERDETIRRFFPTTTTV